MNNTKQASSPRRRAPRLAAMAVAAMMTLGSANVSAWIPVQETGTSLIQHLLNQINTYKTEATAYAAKAQDAAEYVEQNTRWIRTLEQYRQALIQVQAAVNSFGMPDSAPLVPVAPNYLDLYPEIDVAPSERDAWARTRTWPAAGLAPWLPMRLQLTIVASLSCFLAAGAT